MSYLGQLWIPVSDLKKALKFYIDKLGLILGIEVDEKKYQKDKKLNLKNSFAILQNKSENTVVVLIEKPDIFPLKNIGVVTGWVVENIELIKKTMEEKGVIFLTDILDFGDRKIVTFEDFDGNQFQLVEVNKK